VWLRLSDWGSEIADVKPRPCGWIRVIAAALLGGMAAGDGSVGA
jgi:hypothetical protein